MRLSSTAFRIAVSSISQILKSKWDREVLRNIKDKILGSVLSTQGVYLNAKDQDKPRILNYLAYHFGSTLESLGGLRNLRGFLNDAGDYLAEYLPHLKNKLNNPEYLPQQVLQEAQDWHLEMDAKESNLPNQEFIDALPLADGWQWVSLDAGYCKMEADAMGHCGNANAAEGDNILSLRDPQGQAHLTFIVNNKILGEMKGRNNSKPSPKYHPAIVKLLESDWVASIRGGGYAPERNFSLSDLPEETQEYLVKLKPTLGSWVKYAIESGSSEIHDLLEVSEMTPIGGGYILERWDDLSDFSEGVQETLESIDEGYYDGYTPDWGEVEGLIRTPALISEMRNLAEASLPEGQTLLDDSDIMENFDISQAVSQAYSDSMSSGTYKRYYEGLISSLERSEDGYGFSVSPPSEANGYKWVLSVSEDSLKEFMETHGEDIESHWGSLENYIESEDIFGLLKLDTSSEFDYDYFEEALKGRLAEI